MSYNQKLGVATRTMKTTILAFMLFTGSLLAEPKLPASAAIAIFTADPVPPAPSEHFKEFRVERADFNKILDAYYTVTRDQWLHLYSHVAFGDRTGTATLKDGTVLKWLVRPGGLATVTFPDGTILYLAASKPATTISEVAHQPVSHAAQVVLDDLSLKCSSPAWSSEFDLIERPKARPTNYIVSGEVSAYLADAKKRLAEFGVSVKWNHETKRYEVEATK